MLAAVGLLHDLQRRVPRQALGEQRGALDAAGMSVLPHHWCATSCATTANGRSMLRGSASGFSSENASWYEMLTGAAWRSIASPGCSTSRIWRCG